MPSKMRSFFKRKNKQDVLTVKSLDRDDVRGSTPPMMEPIDPDGSTASHDSSHVQQQSRSSGSSPGRSSTPEETLTQSQFKSGSDEEMDRLRHDQPPNSPFSKSQADTANFRSRTSSRHRNCDTKSRDGVPVITSQGADYFSPSAVSSKGNYATEGFYSKSKKHFRGKERPKQRPTARTSAFGGAPRYDWMDIETTAAIKIQAAYRRLQTQNDLDRRNLSTPGMRNRRAQRRARYESRMSRHITSADVPFPFNLCGVGLLFGDSTFEDEKIVDTLEKRRAQKQKLVYVREDEEKRKFHMRKQQSQHMEEGIEVVESFDANEEETEEGEDHQEEEVQSSGKSRRSLRSMGRSMSRKSGKSSMSPGRSKSKFLNRDQNEFDPAEDDESL